MRKAEVISTKELARRWDGYIAYGTIENWRQEGRGPKFIKLGKEKTSRIVYKLVEVKRFEKIYFKGNNTWRKLQSR